MSNGRIGRAAALHPGFIASLISDAHRLSARFSLSCALFARAEALQGVTRRKSGELSELGFYPVTNALAHMPVVDVTEFMLNRVSSYAAASPEFNPLTPVFRRRTKSPSADYGGKWPFTKLYRLACVWIDGGWLLRCN